MGGLSECTFTFTLILKIILLQNAYFTEKLSIQRVEKTFTEIPEICVFFFVFFCQIRIFLPKNSKFYFSA